MSNSKFDPQLALSTQKKIKNCLNRTEIVWSSAI